MAERKSFSQPSLFVSLKTISALAYWCLWNSNYTVSFGNLNSWPNNDLYGTIMAVRYGQNDSNELLKHILQG